MWPPRHFFEIEPGPDAPTPLILVGTTSRIQARSARAVDNLGDGILFSVLLAEVHCLISPGHGNKLILPLHKYASLKTQIRSFQEAKRIVQSSLLIDSVVAGLVPPGLGLQFAERQPATRTPNTPRLHKQMMDHNPTGCWLKACITYTFLSSHYSRITSGQALISRKYVVTCQYVRHSYAGRIPMQRAGFA